MFSRIKEYSIPHLIGAGLLFGGWFVSVALASWDKITENRIFTTGRVVGLVMIFVGAYLPEIWIAFVHWRKKD